MNIKVYALDQYSYDYFKSFHENVFLYNKEDFQNKYLSQSDKNFGNLMIVKFELIYKELLENENVLYIDGDIVLKNLSSYLFKLLQMLILYFKMT